MNSYSRLVLFFLFYILTAGYTVGVCEVNAGPLSNRRPGAEDKGPSKSKANPGTWLASIYGKTLSRVDGDRCPSLPSCYAYSGMAFRKHGFFIGWVMTVDRLIHEADEPSVSPVVYHDGKLKVLDPVENNDWWWYDGDETIRK